MYALGVTTFGFGGEWSDGKVAVSAACHPILLGWDVLGVLCFYVLVRRRDSPRVVGFPGSGRRIVALFVDLYFGTTILASVGGLIILALEASRTGRFEWSFERQYAVTTDYFVAVPIDLLTLGLLFLYLAFPLTRGKQTVGCFIMRIKVEPASGSDRFTLRQAVQCTWSECLALASLPFALIRGRDHRKGASQASLSTAYTTVLVEYL